MQNRFEPLKGLCLQQALIGPNQATGLAGGFDCIVCIVSEILMDWEDEINGLF